jgi:hypothetical protein
VREAPAHLEPGGFCQVLCNWAHLRGHTAEDRLAEWTRGTGCDALVFCTETRDAETYASHWIQHTEGADRARAAALFPRWMEYYDAHGIEAVSAGLVTLRRREGDGHWLRIEPQPPMRGHAGEAIARLFEARDFLAAHADDARFLEARLRLSPDARLRRSFEPPADGAGRDAWREAGAELELVAGLGYRGDPAVASLVARCDGARPLASALRAVAKEARVPEGELIRGALPVVRALVAQGFLHPPELGKEPAPALV